MAVSTTNESATIEQNGKPVLGITNTVNTGSQSFILDNQWAKQAFLTGDANADSTGVYDVKNRYWSSANTKFTDTRMGGNIGINARPQFTPYADIRSKGRLRGRSKASPGNTSGNYGMGRYYSEAIDDNAQRIFLRFGVPQFNSLTNFFSSAFDPNMSTFVRTARGMPSWYGIGQALGTIFSFAAFPAISSTLLAGRMLNVFFGKPTSKFYTIKPAMHLYWSAVDMLVNTIAVNKGILPRVMDDGNTTQGINNPYKLDQTMLSNISSLIPDMVTQDNRIDVFAVANRASRMANNLFMDDYENLNNGSATDWLGYLNKGYGSEVHDSPGGHSFLNFVRKNLSIGYYTATEGQSRLELSAKTDPQTEQPITEPPAGFGNYFDAEFAEGSQFAVFIVDHTGPISESFSSSAVESDLSNKANNAASQAREARFSFAGGNLFDNAIGNMAEEAVGAIASLVQGAISGATGGLSNVFLNFGTGFLDIQKHWQSSTATLPTANYTMQLITPYNNPISQMQNIHIPLAMILAPTLPLSTGKQSYTSPLMAQLYDRARCQIQTGMIQSLSITRGVSNLAFTNRGQVIAIDVSFSIMDMSSIMHMPVSTGSLFGADQSMDEDNILMDYLAVLAGQDMYSQIYTLPKAKLSLAKKITQAERLTSPAYWASLIHSETTTGMLSNIMPVGKLLDAAVGRSLIIPGISPGT